MRKLCAILISFVFFISLVDMHPAAAEDIDGISGSDVCNEDFSASEIKVSYLKVAEDRQAAREALQCAAEAAELREMLLIGKNI